jgi:hypothetical protein
MAAPRWCKPLNTAQSSAVRALHGPFSTGFSTETVSNAAIGCGTVP